MLFIENFLRLQCWMADSAMKGSGWERTKILWFIRFLHYIFLPALLLFISLWNKRCWMIVFIFVLFVISTEIMWKTCSIYELERYIMRWDDEGWNADTLVIEYEEKIRKKPWFFLRFVVLSCCYLGIMLLLGWGCGYWKV